MADQASAIGRLFGGMAPARRSTIRFEIAGPAGGGLDRRRRRWPGVGTDFLMRQVACIGGGTTEMARNVISERVLGMPRDQTSDRDIAFRDVPAARRQRAGAAVARREPGGDGVGRSPTELSWWGSPRSMALDDGSGQRVVTTFGRV